MPLTDEQKAARLDRRHQILTRVTGSGEAHGDEAAKIAANIENFEWAEGDEDKQNQRQSIVASMLGSGHIKMADIVETAKTSLAVLEEF